MGKTDEDTADKDWWVDLTQGCVRISVSPSNVWKYVSWQPTKCIIIGRSTLSERCAPMMTRI